MNDWVRTPMASARLARPATPGPMPAGPPAQSKRCTCRSSSMPPVLPASGSGLRSPHQPAGKRTGGLAVAIRLGPGDEGVEIASRPLHQALSARRQVEGHVGGAELEVLEVNDEQIGPVPGR